MSEQRKRLERALRGCAERGVPAETVDLWPSVRERVSGEQMSGTRASEEQVGEERGAGTPRRRAWPPRLVPNTPLGWALAVLSVLILGTGVYAASGPVGELIGVGLPGPAGPGVAEHKGEQQTDGGSGVSYRLFQEAVPGGEGEEVGQTITEDGAKVTLEWAYADTQFVVVGFSVRDLKEDRRNAGNLAALEPIFVGKEDENAPSAPARRSELTDEGGRHFALIDGTAMVAGPGASPEEIRAPKAHLAVFEAPEGLEPSPNHRFRLEIFLEERPVPSSWKEAEEGWQVEEKPPIGPLVFDFEISVRPVPVVEVGQKETTKGITLTLERVLNSPGRPQAVVCFEPPNDDYLWRPSTAPTGFQREEPLPVHELQGDCWSLTLEEPVKGRSSVTVTEILGYPRSERAMREDEDGKEIRGPWTFEFEAPGR